MESLRIFIQQKTIFSNRMKINFLIIIIEVCGEFSSDVEILSKSTEPEKVFQISKIINHPRYQPNRVIRIE